MQKRKELGQQTGIFKEECDFIVMNSGNRLEKSFFIVYFNPFYFNGNYRTKKVKALRIGNGQEESSGCADEHAGNVPACG